MWRSELSPSEEILKTMPLAKMSKLNEAQLTRVQKNLLQRLEELADNGEVRAQQLVTRVRLALIEFILLTLYSRTLAREPYAEALAFAVSHLSNSMGVVALHLRGKVSAESIAGQ
jgi:hypothetical protein